MPTFVSFFFGGGGRGGDGGEFDRTRGVVLLFWRKQKGHDGCTLRTPRDMGNDSWHHLRVSLHPPPLCIEIRVILTLAFFI
ncbi:Uncharacterized protein TCM_037731 [Theobroma cacao]|uniref:Uncharacterized protein n=1 Tax=Theobroma cacao TaxID=3641 RepID=A0A061GM09_THECC|nr:Uncharacterized protein TCM_037731 [Theobroma cacao]